MSESTPNLDDLTIQKASKDQRFGIIERITAEWGSHSIGIEYFTRQHEIHEAKEYSTEGKLVYWVLVPKSNRNTTDFYASCRTYQREVLVLRPDQVQATSEVGYIVTAVYTEPKHRGKGYASRLMTLIHRALAYHIYPDSNIQIPPEVKPATLSVLYSDVGGFYTRCGPSTSESGWKILASNNTTWTIKETLALLETYPLSSYDVTLLSGPQIADLLNGDVPDFDSLPSSPTTAYFAFPPRLPALYVMSRSEMSPSHRRDIFVAWGAHIPSKGHFIVWSFDYGDKVLTINRLKADSDTLPVLLRAAFQVGEVQECKSAEAGNVARALWDTAKILGGITEDCKNHFPAYRWYGKEHEGAVTWVMNE